jgi:hypothetical protein
VSTYTPSPTQREFMLDPSYVRVLAGPVGGGKSVTCVHELVRLATLQAPNAQGVRKTRAVIVRNTADQLALTTRKTVFDWLPPGQAGHWKAVEKTFVIQATLADGTKLESEWIFIPLDTPDDVRKALSLETTFLWGNESRELHPEVVDGLLSRLNRYPSAKDGGPTRSCALFDTNMPDEETWWHDKMENPPSNWAVYKQPPAILRLDVFTDRFDTESEEVLQDKDGVEWAVNPECDNYNHLPKQYYPNLIPGKTEDWLRVYLRSEYGRSLSGTPVYDKTFTADFHVSKEPLRAVLAPDYPIIIGVDFGRTPAAVFGQRDPRGRVLILGEVTSENMGIETFLRTKLNPYIANHFPGHSFICAPDPAGFHKQQLGEVSLVDVLRQAGFKCVKPPTNDPEKRIQAVERLLCQQLEGKALFLVDPGCTDLIRGFKFGYRYKVKRNGEQEDRPEKNSSSHCFVGDTPVLTARGWTPISEVRVGDFVVTRFGNRRVTATMNRLATELVEVASGEHRVVCTPDHPFVVGETLVRADALQYATILELTSGEHQWQKPSTSTENSTVSGTTSARQGTTSPRHQNDSTSTGLFGSSTTVLSKVVSAFTTKITTGATTHWKTWSCLAGKNTSPCTQSTALNTSSTTCESTCEPLCSQQLQNGMRPKKGENGTASTLSTSGLTKKLRSTLACIATASILQKRSRSSEGFVLQSAKAPHAAQVGSTTKSETAQSATQSSRPVSTQKPSSAVSVVVRPVSEKSLTRVYDLTVDGAHEFVAGGFVVGNCHDALQYCCLIIDMNVRGVSVGSSAQRREVRSAGYRYT